MSFKKQLSIQLAIAFGVVIATIVLTQLAAGSLSASAAKILQQKSDLAFRIRATGQLASLKADSDKAQPLFALLNNTLPVKDDLINLGQALVQLAKSGGVDLGFTFGGETAAKGELPGFIKFSLTGNGSYEAFQKFLSEIEKSRYYLKLNSVDLVRQPGGTNFSITADGQVFYQ